MQNIAIQKSPRRYQGVEAGKAHGVTYTPANLARFVAEHIVENADLEGRTEISILDPAIGDGELVLALVEALKGKTNAILHIRGFDTNAVALDEAARRIQAIAPSSHLELKRSSFLEFAIPASTVPPTLFNRHERNEKFDLIIANPPYVRTQIMGSHQAQQLAARFGLSGRVDLYQAFLLGMAEVLAPDGAAGVIVSNRFMTTKGGQALRATLKKKFSLRQIWDLGDTKLFNAAVLPAVIIARGTASPPAEQILFSTIYEEMDENGAATVEGDPITALAHTGSIMISDGRKFCVRHGTLDCSGKESDVWRLASESGDEWLKKVNSRTWKRFGEIGKIRVGVKTCADKIFIRHDWDSVLGTEKPELLRPLTTHHGAGRFRPVTPKKIREILYPHQVIHGRRQAIPIEQFPKSLKYLSAHRAALESRSYLIDAGRRWYELWVPQDPEAWSAPKLVFRDISERPTFWLDLEGSVVNGDCYWLVVNGKEETDLLWLAAAVANSTFAEAFYDHRFNNKLYSGRRRFITQYVEQFPLPDPDLPLSREIIILAKAIYDRNHAQEVADMERELDERVWQVFG